MTLGLVAALLVLSGCGESLTGPGPDASPTAGAGASSSGGPWPQPQEETFQGCPPGGDGGDGQLNLRKNRIDSGAWEGVSLQDLLALTWPPAVASTRRADWSPDDAAAVARDEGRPVITEGYILKVRHEGPESPNCHDSSQRDYHVWLGSSPTATRDTALVVELTPRVVAQNPGWGAQASILRLAGHHVRVAGWLLLDQEHPEQLHRTRGTLWEIHPVMQLDVELGGSWRNLAAGSALPGGARGGQGSGAGSGTGTAPYHPHRRRRRHH